MKKDFGEKIVDFANWFNLNILIVFAPFIVINLMNCIMGYNIGFEDIISDYAGLTYSTSVVLLVCILDSIKRNGRLIVTQILLQYAILSFIICMLIYTIINICNRFFYTLYFDEKNYHEIILRMFRMLTIIMILNIFAIIMIKVQEFFLSKNK